MSMVGGGAAGCLRPREGSQGPDCLPPVEGCQWLMANGTGNHVVNDGGWSACARACLCARACAQPDAKGIATSQWVEQPMANGRWPGAPTQWPMANGHGSKPQWPMANGEWPTANGQAPRSHLPTSPTANGQWPMGHGLRTVAGDPMGQGCSGACGCSRCLQAACDDQWPMGWSH